MTLGDLKIANLRIANLEIARLEIVPLLCWLAITLGATGAVFGFSLWFAM